MKICSTCKVIHPLSMYYKNKSREDGYHSQCKACQHEYYLRTKEKQLHNGKEYRSRNKEIIARKATQKYHRTKEYTQASTMSNWEQHMLHNTKANAKRRDIECTLILNDIVIPEKCPYLNIPLTRVVGKGQLLTNASIDRIDSTKGYTLGNIQIISRLANTMKNSATKEQLNIFARNVLKLHATNKGD